MTSRIAPEHVGFADGGSTANNGYQATRCLTLWLLLQPLVLDVERFTFIDIGRGMGVSTLHRRAHHFRRVVVVVLSPMLAERGGGEAFC